MWGLYLAIVAVCAVFSAFFSATDLAYGMVDQERLKKAGESGDKKAELALKIAQDYEWSISSICVIPKGCGSKNWLTIGKSCCGFTIVYQTVAIQPKWSKVLTSWLTPPATPLTRNAAVSVPRL